MFNSWFKKITESFPPRSFLIWLAKIGVTPNLLTLFSTTAKIGTLYLFFRGEIFWGGVVAVIDYLFDFLDGRLARATNNVTKFGGFLDFLSDRFLREAWFLALAYSGTIPWTLAVLILFIDAISYLLNEYVDTHDLKHIPWIPHIVRLVVYGALLGHVLIFLKVEVLINAFLFFVTLVTITVLNLRNPRGGSLPSSDKRQTTEEKHVQKKQDL